MNSYLNVLFTFRRQAAPSSRSLPRPNESMTASRGTGMFTASGRGYPGNIPSQTSAHSQPSGYNLQHATLEVNTD